MTVVPKDVASFVDRVALGKVNDRGPPLPEKLIVTSREFVKDYRPPDYLIIGLIQRSYLYTLTARTGDGKTAIAICLTAHVARGQKIGDIAVKRGPVLYCAGENPADIQARWIAQMQEMGVIIDPDAFSNVYFIPGAYPFGPEFADRIVGDVEKLAVEFALIIIDTQAAFFPGDDENSNTQIGEFFRVVRRKITMLHGGPAVIVLCHPTKNAGNDNLIPRGGGASLAEVDGNLTAIKEEWLVTVHTQGKFRGPDFAPIQFKLETRRLEELKDTDGRHVPTVIATPISEEDGDRIRKALKDDSRAVLLSIADHPELTERDRASRLKWYQRDTRPYQARVHRRIVDLKEAKLIAGEPGLWELTPKGEKLVKRYREAGQPKTDDVRDEQTEAQ